MNTFTNTGFLNLDQGFTLGLSSGQKLYNSATLVNYGSLDVGSGATLGNGGLLYNRGLVNNSGALINQSGGKLFNQSQLNNYGSLNNQSGGTLVNFGQLSQLNNFGSLINQSGGELDNWGRLYNYGSLSNQSGGTLVNAYGLVANYGVLNNEAGGTLIGYGGTIRNLGTINNGGDLRNEYGGFLKNYSGATLSGTGSVLGDVLNSGLIQGGEPSGNNLYGTMTFASGTLTNSGSVHNVSLSSQALMINSGTASGTLIGNGGAEIVYDAASAETVSSGGIVTAAIGGSITGDTVLSGGEIAVWDGTVTDLTLNQGALVDFATVQYVAGETVTVRGGALEVLDSNGNVLASVGLAGGTYTGASYTLADDGAGAVLVSVAVSAAICYLEGTQILTPTGEVKVETLKAGDTVVTRFSGLQKIRWIGRQSFSGESLKGDWRNIPVHIRAGALGDNVPSRDLYVSPGHSMLVDGTLLLAKNLVNGITITQGWTPEQVEYYQLDLGAHDCVLAEGAWSETFADAGDLREEFHNSADFTARFPNVRAPDAIALCAPRPEKGDALANGLITVLARAGHKTAGKLRGHVDKVHGGFKVEGWAQDLSNPDLPVTLEVLHDGVVLGEVLACDYRPDLQKAGVGRGYSAFTFVSPIRLNPNLLSGLSVQRKSDGLRLGVNPEITGMAPAIHQVNTGSTEAENALTGRGRSAVASLRLMGGKA